MSESRAIRTLGVSVKVGDSPIGYFGTGLKFALATILRKGGEIVLKRGLQGRNGIPQGEHGYASTRGGKDHFLG